MLTVLFVCLGNICRSPMAEAVFSQLVAEAGLADQFVIRSAGTGAYHVGEPPHQGTRRILRDNGISYTGRASQIKSSDVTPDTYLIALDRNNLRDLRRRFGDHARLFLLLDFAPHSRVKDVPDPYYSGNFEEVYQLVTAGCTGLLAMICAQEKLQPVDGRQGRQ